MHTIYDTLQSYRKSTVSDKILIINYNHEVIKKTFPYHERSFILFYEQEDVATIVGWNEMIGILPPTGNHVSNLQLIEI